MQAKKKYHENSLTILYKKIKSYAGNSRSDCVNKFRKQIFEGHFLFAQFVIDAYTFSQCKNLLKQNMNVARIEIMLSLVLMAVFMYVVLVIISQGKKYPLSRSW